MPPRANGAGAGFDVSGFGLRQVFLVVGVEAAQVGVCLFAVGRRHFVPIVMEFFALKVGRNHRKQAHFGEGATAASPRPLTPMIATLSLSFAPFAPTVLHEGNIISAPAANEPFVKSPLFII